MPSKTSQAMTTSPEIPSPLAAPITVAEEHEAIQNPPAFLAVSVNFLRSSGIFASFTKDTYLIWKIKDFFYFVYCLLYTCFHYITQYRFSFT